ncbi:MAG TPA: hypothetical protein VFQ54_13675, partial [Thermomicrobiales bacterium]|nr:hypothetical protein [Thermomicrobiales bacterium]
YLQAPARDPSAAWLLPIANEYRQSFDLRELRWNLQEKAGRGGFATLLGGQIDLKQRILTCMAVGDTCLYIRHQGEIVPFPARFRDTTAFGDHPFLIATNPTYNDNIMERRESMKARLPKGETIMYAMTDSLARWFAEGVGAGDAPWRRMDRVVGGGGREFSRFIDAERQRGTLEDDDSTMLRIRILLK